MDFLDLHSGFRNPYSISYELPRFCNIKTADFDYANGADYDWSSSDGNRNYGVLSVSASYSLCVLFFMHI